MNNIPDRALLKNLGHWLGIITIAKNKPILATVSRLTDFSDRSLIVSPSRLGSGNEVIGHRSVSHRFSRTVVRHSVRGEDSRIVFSKQSKAID